MAKKSNTTLNQKKKNPKLVFFLIAGIFVLAMALLFFLDKAPTSKKGIDFDLTGQALLGQEDAPVKIVEFGDYKCIYCKNFDESIFPQIKKDYIDTGKVQYYFINKAFIGPDSAFAAFVGEGIYAQNPDAFWDYHHAVYKNQGPEDQQWATMEYLLTLVKKQVPDVDLPELAKYLSTNSLEDVLAPDNKLAQQAKIQSTPTVFINGVEVEDSFDYDGIQKMIDQAMEK